MKMPCVYRTDSLNGYLFSNQRNDLVIDRKDSEAAEVLFTVLEPGQKTLLHNHRDCEQLWYIIEGRGRLLIKEGDEQEEHNVGPGDVVLTRRLIYHRIENCGDKVLRYLAVDIFVGERLADEPTWDAHIEAYCRHHGREVKRVKVKNGSVV
jgi:mannose-6-phosphate isomerase-like protein (cupin superfamily)